MARYVSPREGALLDEIEALKRRNEQLLDEVNACRMLGAQYYYAAPRINAHLSPDAKRILGELREYKRMTRTDLGLS
jgi:hypothetical protein